VILVATVVAAIVVGIDAAVGIGIPSAPLVIVAVGITVASTIVAEPVAVTGIVAAVIGAAVVAIAAAVISAAAIIASAAAPVKAAPAIAP
jgi:hypothetical protein